MHCEKEKELSQIQKDLYYGNGKPSVMERINTLEGDIDHIKSIDENVKKLMKANTENETRAGIDSEKKTDNKWFIGMLLTTVISLATMILNILL